MIKDLTSFISGICLILLSVVLFHEANQLSPFASVFPYAITSILLLLSISIIVLSNLKSSIECAFIIEKYRNNIKLKNLNLFFIYSYHPN